MPPLLERQYARFEKAREYSLRVSVPLKMYFQVFLIVVTFISISSAGTTQQSNDIQKKFDRFWADNRNDRSYETLELFHWKREGDIVVELLTDDTLSEECKSSLAAQVERAIRTIESNAFKMHSGICTLEECVLLDMSQGKRGLDRIASRYSGRTGLNTTLITAPNSAPELFQLSNESTFSIHSAYFGLRPSDLRGRTLYHSAWPPDSTCPTVDFEFYLKSVSVVGFDLLKIRILGVPPFNAGDEWALLNAVFTRFYGLRP